jgi:hypothetical protein
VVFARKAAASRFFVVASPVPVKAEYFFAASTSPEYE